MPKNISRSQKKGAAGPEQPLNLLDAVRQVGDEALQNVYKLALKREKLRRKSVEPPPPVARCTMRELMAKCWSEWLMIQSDRYVALRQDALGRWILVYATDPDKSGWSGSMWVEIGGPVPLRILKSKAAAKKYAEEFGFIVTGLVRVLRD
jgi:hypothetical protein